MFCKPITVLNNVSFLQEYYQSLYYNRFFRPPYWRVLLPLCHFRQLRSAGATSLLQSTSSPSSHWRVDWTHCSLSVRPAVSTSRRPSPPTHVEDFTLFASGESGEPDRAERAKRTQRKWTTWQTPTPTDVVAGRRSRGRERESGKWLHCTCRGRGKGALAPAVEPGPAGRSERRPRRGGRRH